MYGSCKRAFVTGRTQEATEDVAAGDAALIDRCEAIATGKARLLRVHRIDVSDLDLDAEPPCLGFLHQNQLARRLNNREVAQPGLFLAGSVLNSFAGIAPGSVSPFVVLQLIGGVFGYTFTRGLYPNTFTIAAEAVARR